LYELNFSVIPPLYLRIMFEDNYLLYLVGDLIKKNNVYNAISIFNRIGDKNFYDIKDFAEKKRELQERIIIGLFINYVINIKKDNLSTDIENNFISYINSYENLIKVKDGKFENIKNSNSNSLFPILQLVEKSIFRFVKLTVLKSNRYKNINSPDFIKALKILDIPNQSSQAGILKDFFYSSEYTNKHNVNIFEQIIFGLLQYNKYATAINFIEQLPNKEQIQIIKNIIELLSENDKNEFIRIVNYSIKEKTVRAYSNQFLIENSLSDKSNAEKTIPVLIENYYSDENILAQCLYTYYYDMSTTKISSSEIELYGRIKALL